MSSRFTYEINDNNEVSIYDTSNPTENGAPNIRQTHRPNGYDAFASKAEAKEWAEDLIDQLLNPPIINAEIIDEKTTEAIEPPAGE